MLRETVLEKRTSGAHTGGGAAWRSFASGPFPSQGKGPASRKRVPKGGLAAGSCHWAAGARVRRRGREAAAKRRKAATTPGSKVLQRRV